MGKTNFDLYLEEKLRDPEFRERFEAAGRHWKVAIKLVELRKEAKLTQKQLAEKVGTTQQQISRLESPSYCGHSLQALERVANALSAQVEVTFKAKKSAQNAVKPASAS